MQRECGPGEPRVLAAVDLSYARRPSLAAMRAWYASVSASEYRPTASSAASCKDAAAAQAQDAGRWLTAPQGPFTPCTWQLPAGRRPAFTACKQSRNNAVDLRNRFAQS
jgi:hypothetical protein